MVIDAAHGINLIAADVMNEWKDRTLHSSTINDHDVALIQFGHRLLDWLQSAQQSVIQVILNYPGTSDQIMFLF
jgi:hypothetical protein